MIAIAVVSYVLLMTNGCLGFMLMEYHYPYVYAYDYARDYDYDY
jgi:hypothetical protein